jgi:hypothetical protein
MRGVAPQMRDQAAYLTLGGGAGGRSLGSIFCFTYVAALYLGRRPLGPGDRDLDSDKPSNPERGNSQ